MHKLALPVLSLLAVAGALRSQEIYVPQLTFTASSSGNLWRSTAFRWQTVFDNSHFTSAGVTGPITINRLRFRGQDGTPNVGGQMYTNVSVTLYDAPTTSAIVLSTSAGPAASTATVIQSATALVASQFASGATDARRCFSLTFTSGANIGLTRFISANAAGTITVSVAFPAAPAIGDTFDVTRAPINFNNVAAAFAANVGANVGATEVFPTVTIAPSVGSLPNNPIIDMALTTSAFVYDPTTMGNLVVEVSCAAAPVPSALTPSFSTGNVAATHRSSANRAGTATAVTGALSDFGAAIHMDFTGPGGHPLADVPATVVSYGGGCNAQSNNAYQAFGFQEFDLRGSPTRSLVFKPDALLAPTAYAVTAGVTGPDMTMALGAVNTGDDALVTHTPGWAAPFNYVGGTTSDIHGCSNGFVWLGVPPAVPVGANVDFTPSLVEWLGNGAANLPARVAPFWHDFAPQANTTTHPGAGMYHHTDITGGPGNFVTYVTWKDVGEWNPVFGAAVLIPAGQSVNNFQCVFYEATGEIEFRYGSMTGLLAGNGITGFTQGSLGGGVNSTDSGSRDLSEEVPFTTAGPNGAQGPLTLSTNARPVVGTSTNMTVTNIPASANVGFYVFDFEKSSPGIQLPPFLAPGCMASIKFSPNWGSHFDFFVNPGVTSTSLGWPGPMGAPTWPVAFVGAHVYIQYSTAAVFLAGGETSNALDLQLGFN